jgi:hypothetical protein
MTGPRPIPPYLPIHPVEERPGIQDAYRRAESKWQRAAILVMWLIAVIPLLCALLVVAIAALMAPSIVMDAIAMFAGW